MKHAGIAGTSRSYSAETLSVSWVALVGMAICAASVMAENPSSIYAYDVNSSTFERDSLMASLSGIVARTSPEVFMAERMANSNFDPEFWLNEFLDDHPGTTVTWQTSIPWYLSHYRDRLQGYVVYDAATINEATSVAGALGAVMVHESLLSGTIGTALNSAGLSRLEDVRGKNSSWVFNHYGPLLNKDMIFRQQPTFSHQLRDLAVLNAGFVFNNDGSARDQFLAGQNDHSRVFGWGFNNSEEEFFSSASRNNLMAVPADHLRSSAAPSRWDVPRPPQARHTDPNTPTQPGKHYVAFVMSDGDNVQWLTNDFARDPRWFGSPHRGTFPMTFDLSPSLADVHPVAFRYIYEQAASDPESTYFVTAGGYGIHYPSQTPDIAGSMEVTSTAMAAVDHNIISVLDTSYDLSALGQMADAPPVLGLMVKTGAAYSGRHGSIDWHNGKPIVSIKYSLWDGFDTPNAIISSLNSAPTDPFNSIGSYTIVNVHPWSTSRAGGGQGDPMSNVAYILQNLGDHVQAVTVEELMIHLRNNFGTPVGSPWGDNLVANGDFEVVAVDGGGNPTGHPRDWHHATASGATAWVDDDSNGDGSHAAAINQPFADWRSFEYEAHPGEQLQFSFDFKLIDVPDGSGFRADARFFNQSGAGAGFVGETVEFIHGADYPNNTWQSFSSTVDVPEEGAFGDLRFSTYFGPFSDGQIRIDNVRMKRLPDHPGDFDGNGLLECADVDSLVAQIVSGMHVPTFDLTGDGAVNPSDLTAWLAEAGATNLASGNPYRYGDANLDGLVDGSDFSIWNGHKFTAVAAWCSGDFSADGVVDGSDFSVWNANRFLSALSRALPEPAVSAVIPITMIGLLDAFRRKKPRKPTDIQEKISGKISDIQKLVRARWERLWPRIGSRGTP